MTLLLTGISFFVNLLLCLFVRRNDYSLRSRILFFLLGALLPLQSGLGLWIFRSNPETAGLIGSLYGAATILVALVLVDLGFTFLRISAHFSMFSVGPMKISRLGLLEIAAVSAAVVSLASPAYAVVNGNPSGIMLTGWGIGVCAVAFLLIVVALYKLEVAFAAATAHLRGIGRFYFLGLAAVGLFSLFFLTRLILFRNLSADYVNAQAIVNIVAFPAIVGGNLRYRLGRENVVVSPTAVYSSVTLLFFGTFLVSLVLAIAGAQMLGIGFSLFEEFALIFTASFGVILLIASGSMRRRIVRLTRSLLYHGTYDYRSLFFHIHAARIGDGNLTSAIDALIDVMRSTPLIVDCRVFLLNPEDRRLHDVPRSHYSRNDGCSFSASGNLVKRLEHDDQVIYGAAVQELLGKEPDAEESRLLRELRADLLMPIRHQDDWAGLIAARTSGAPVREEDISVLRAFAGSLSSVILQHRTMHERGDRARVEFFSQFSSFVAHEIKNQAATLVLITRNAAEHIDKPAFQKSLIASLKSCADALQSLIFRLGTPPKPESLTCVSVPVDGVIGEAMQSCGMEAAPGIVAEIESRPAAKVLADRMSLFYILKNLMSNAVDAMSGVGKLTVRLGTADALPAELVSCSLPASMHPGRYLYVTVEDTGTGMDEGFVRDKLFRAFSTTKEKGFGVGLYQSKLLVESMQGRIACRSEMGKGTSFCVFLPLA